MIMATEDARYRETTQFRYWSFSRPALLRQREETNAEARATIAPKLSLALSVSLSLSQSGPNSSTNTPEPEQSQIRKPPPSSSLSSSAAAAASGEPPDFLTAAEETQLLDFYCFQLLDAAEHLALASEVRSTAAIFLRRFYTTNSIMAYPPADMVLVALFSGCKAEGHFWNVKQFATELNLPASKAETILAGEFLLCQGIRFHFDVRHPFRALEGAAMQLARLGEKNDGIQKAQRRARDILRWTPLMTDAYFHYTPSQIMLAALSLADRRLVEKLVQETFHVSQPQAGNGNATTRTDGDGDDGGGQDQSMNAALRDKVLGTVEACRNMLDVDLPPPGTDFKAHYQQLWKDRKPVSLNSKLKKCRDPDRKNLAALEKARREQAMKDAESDDDGAGAGAGHTLADDEAVFGGPIDASGGGARRDAKRRKVAEHAAGPAG